MSVVSGNIYFAGGFMEDPKDPKGRKVFQIVQPSGENALPYLTYSPNGLRTTSHHANLYRLSEDGKKAMLADLRCPNVYDNGAVKLSEAQQEAVKKAIQANHFYR